MENINYLLKQEDYTIEKNKLKQIALFLGSMAFVFIGFLMILTDLGSRRMSPEMAMVLGFIGVFFFGLSGLLILFNLITSKYALRMNAEGIVNSSHVGSGYLIRWENIKHLKINFINKRRIIEIYLNDEEEIYSQLNVFARNWMKLNGGFMGTPAFISGSMITMKLDDVLEAIGEQKKSHSKK